MLGDPLVAQHIHIFAYIFLLFIDLYIYLRFIYVNIYVCTHTQPMISWSIRMPLMVVETRTGAPHRMLSCAPNSCYGESHFLNAWPRAKLLLLVDQD